MQNYEDPLSFKSCILCLQLLVSAHMVQHRGVQMGSLGLKGGLMLQPLEKRVSEPGGGGEGLSPIL